MIRVDAAVPVLAGEGPAEAFVAIVSARPEREDLLSRRPCVGPAGRLLERALAEAGFDRTEVLLTFVDAARDEIERMRPLVVVRLGRGVRTALPLPDARIVLDAAAPSSVLRSRGPRRVRGYASLVEVLVAARQAVITLRGEG